MRRMPIGLFLRKMWTLSFVTDKDRRRAMMRELASRKRLRVSREEIEWYPTVDAERCTGCRVCVEFCPRNVYRLSDAGAEVENPYRCVLLCSKCASKCPAGAISFPNPRDFRSLIYYE